MTASQRLTPDRAVQDRIEALDAYWRAANYLGAAQLYLRENVLLREPLAPAHVKLRPLGHWGTQPGLNLIYAHLDRLIADTQANVLLVVGPGHGAPAILANLWLEGSLPHDDVAQFVKEFSWPGGSPSHLTAQTRGAIHEGGELGYSLAHAFGAVLDNPDLIAACVVGDGEAETGPLAASWRYNAFLNPRSSGAVLPILHLNGYKLSGPTLLGRTSDEQLREFFSGLGYETIVADAQQIGAMHANMWEAFDLAYGRIRAIQEWYRMGDAPYGTIPRWPLVIVRSEKGETGPYAGTFRSHGLPLSSPATDLEQLATLERWLRSYQPQALFDAQGNPVETILSLLPPERLRMGRNPHANGGTLAVPLDLPEADAHYRAVDVPGAARESPMERAGEYLKDVMLRNNAQQNFRIFCPDETLSNKLEAIFDVTDRAFMGPIVDTDEYISPDGRVIEILSEHCCEGWLEGYLLTGRHGVFACYEGFVPIVDSMVHQYGKWLKMSREVPWRVPIPSLNILLTSHVWRQDHNGFSHQAPGFIDSLLTNKSEITRVYLPPDANTMISTFDHCLRGRGELNLIVGGKNEMPQWLNPQQARAHCAAGVGAWEWAGNDCGDPQIVMACSGDVPTMETMAAAQILRAQTPELRVRVVNVVDLMRVAPPASHPHGLSEPAFDALFPPDREVVFAFHGYPSVIHRLLHGRVRPERFHVRGYEEEGTTTTPFDMLVRNRMSRYHLSARAAELACDIHAADRIARLSDAKLDEHRRYIRENGVDMPEVRL